MHDVPRSGRRHLQECCSFAALATAHRNFEGKKIPPSFVHRLTETGPSHGERGWEREPWRRLRPMGACERGKEREREKLANDKHTARLRLVVAGGRGTRKKSQGGGGGGKRRRMRARVFWSGRCGNLLDLDRRSSLVQGVPIETDQLSSVYRSRWYQHARLAPSSLDLWLGLALLSPFPTKRAVARQTSRTRVGTLRAVAAADCLACLARSEKGGSQRMRGE